LQAIEQSTTMGSSGVKVTLDTRAVMASQSMNIIDPATTMCYFAQVHINASSGSDTPSLLFLRVQIYRFMIESRVSDRQLRCKLTEKEFLFEVGENHR
jgi:hypothetical protein